MTIARGSCDTTTSSSACCWVLGAGCCVPARCLLSKLLVDGSSFLPTPLGNCCIIIGRCYRALAPFSNSKVSTQEPHSPSSEPRSTYLPKEGSTSPRSCPPVPPWKESSSELQ
ncbi:hypothetical protein K456DRAFT_740931 [Colletotrichum gloeosporioides 23]|nr:hypothetical protein K456DRAFT_740931 [Colletotrichum gloeosporioides 23]